MTARLSWDGRDIVVHPGGKHGWPTMILDLWKFADWFDEHLRRRRWALSLRCTDDLDQGQLRRRIIRPIGMCA